MARPSSPAALSTRISLGKEEAEGPRSFSILTSGIVFSSRENFSETFWPDNKGPQSNTEAKLTLS